LFTFEFDLGGDGGAGERGRQLALALLHEGQRVVVIEKDDSAEMLADIRAAGGQVVIGSATDPAKQAEARLEQASIVAVVTPCEESNLQVVLAASRRRKGFPVRAIAHATRAFAEMFETQPPFDRIVDGRECGSSITMSPLQDFLWPATRPTS